MRDAHDMLKVMKKSSKGVQKSSKPCDLLFGTVISISPLKVQIDQKLILEQEHLKLTRSVMDYEVEMTVDHVTENRSGGGLNEAFSSHNHEYKGRKKFLIHNGLTVGDRVTLIRAHGGQQYLIIDKEVVQ